ncbi:8602_t:CDS:2 [Paraglomus brasilianum]|uniref:Ragulator complex protein LAMTOR1 n=1 Tax=Paraglomus brasilianum TaxID=144538 RepID=A0A9N9CG50_9GLOM|nr:8602_t:CDS:2 [Paraglomus brasilianum]
MGTKLSTILQPNEQTSLLRDGQPNPYPETPNPRIRQSHYDPAVEQEREERLLQNIVQQTEENLIVISTAKPERLLQQDAIDRANEYKELLSSVKLDNDALQQLHEKINTLTRHQRLSSITIDETTENQKTPYDILSENSITEEEVKMLSEALDEANAAMQHFEIEYVSDLVVPLTWVSSTPVH